MGFPKRFQRWYEDWKKHRGEQARLHEAHNKLLQALTARFAALGGKEFTLPARIDASTLDLWRRNATQEPLPEAAAGIRAVLAEENGRRAAGLTYAFLRPLDGATLMLEACLPAGIVYFRFRE